MSDGREEREERERRIDQEKQEDRQDLVDRDELDEWKPERVDSRAHQYLSLTACWHHTVGAFSLAA